MKTRKQVIDGLEGKVTGLQNKIASVRQWNFNQLALLEERESNLEAFIIDLSSRNEDLNEKSKETELNFKAISTAEKNCTSKAQAIKAHRPVKCRVYV